LKLDHGSTRVHKEIRHPCFSPAYSTSMVQCRAIGILSTLISQGGKSTPYCMRRAEAASFAPSHLISPPLRSPLTFLFSIGRFKPTAFRWWKNDHEPPNPQGCFLPRSYRLLVPGLERRYPPLQWLLNSRNTVSRVPFVLQIPTEYIHLEEVYGHPPSSFLVSGWGPVAGDTIVWTIT